MHSSFEKDGLSSFSQNTNFEAIHRYQVGTYLKQVSSYYDQGSRSHRSSDSIWGGKFQVNLTLPRAISRGCLP